jgi:hypothetical protein
LAKTFGLSLAELLKDVSPAVMRVHPVQSACAYANGDLRMMTKHYAYLSNDYVSNMLKTNLPSFL